MTTEEAIKVQIEKLDELTRKTEAISKQKDELRKGLRLLRIEKLCSDRVLRRATKEDCYAGRAVFIINRIGDNVGSEWRIKSAFPERSPDACLVYNPSSNWFRPEEMLVKGYCPSSCCECCEHFELKK